MSDIKTDPSNEKSIQPEVLENAPEGKAVALNIVENPLRRHDKARVMADAEAFCASHGLEEYSGLFAHAALVARDPHRFEHIDELTDEEKTHLAYERDNRWALSGWLWYSSIICAVGAAVQGWDQTGSNAANLSFPKEFGIDKPTGSDPWKVGAINSIIFLVGGGIGCWFSDPVNYLFGRRGEIFISGIILLVTPIGTGLAQSWQGMFAARFVLGIGLGMKNATVAVYSSEMAPARIRGALVMFWQLWVTFGIFLGYAANLAVKDTGKIAWRLQIGSAFIPAVPLVLGIWFCPESPKWLMKKNRYPDAMQSYLKLRQQPIIAARDLYYSHVLYEEELLMARGTNYFERFRDLFTVPRIRRATWASGMVMLSQQMCGINIIGFYSSTIFVDGGFSPTQALYASLGFGALNFVFAIPALFLIDSFGRRSLLLFGFPMMFLFLLAAGLSFLIPDSESQTRTGVIALFVYIFTIFYSFTEGPVAFQYSAEVFPTVHREQGMAWAVSINLFFAGVLGLTFPPMVAAMGQIGAFCFYAGLNLVAFVGLFLLVPETKLYTLEELDQVFSVTHKTFIGHQLKLWLPYFIKRYIFLNKNAQEPIALIARADEVESRPRSIDDKADL
ncbi:sugar transporter-like protein [Mycena metata]|uniref:Sugar transporter-like protein n=1 Tax=Mycena metata TaxID=1033252 RepID=A0AAD7IGG5_9AGAR|nr:sugar transporter-like protein [Mycena metata]